MNALNTEPKRKLALRKVWQAEEGCPYLYAWVWIAAFCPKNGYPVAAEELEA